MSAEPGVTPDEPSGRPFEDFNDVAPQPGAPVPPPAANELPAALRPLAELPRWVGWKVAKKPGEKPRKLPVNAATGKAASSTDPATWAPLAEVAEAVPRYRLSGPGIVLGDLGDGRWLVGLDYDLSRSRGTGEIMPWAQEKIVRCKTYTEVSPSGTGYKQLGYVRSLPPELWDLHKNAPKGLEITPPGVPVPEGAEGSGHDAPEIGLYPSGRYFAVTGQALEGCPDHIADVTEAVAELAAEMVAAIKPAQERSTRKPRTKSEPTAGEDRPAVDPEALARLPGQLAELIDADPKLAESWLTGSKLGKGGNTSKNGLEFSLVSHLAWRGHPDELIEMAVRHYPHGQVGSGKLTGGNADRRIDRLLQEAERIREKARRWREGEAWFSELLTTKDGEPRDCLANGAIALRKDPAFVGRIRYDEHRGAAVCLDLPWRPGGGWQEWTGADDLRFADWCQTRGLPLRPTTCADAVATVADEHKWHPIRAYLEWVKWDGVPRLSGWLASYLGVESKSYSKAVGRAWMVSAVARIYQPGCKADCALILEGKQGAKKSSALAALVADREWFADEISDLGSKDSAQDLRGKWLIELAELSALKRGDIERVKAFMTRTVDHYRPSYGRRSQDFPRQCVFGGTTNADAYLGDETGNRRFWPVKVGTIDIEALKRDRDQLWAEAVAAFKAGETWWLDGDVERDAREEQAARRIDDPWEQVVLGWAEVQAAPVTVAGILGAMGIPLERQDQLAQTRVARILKASGWERYRHNVGDVRVWGYRPVPPDVPPVPPASGEGGAGNPSVPAACPTCPTCPTVFAHKGDTTTPADTPPLAHPVGGGVSPQNINENRWDIVGQWDSGAGGPPHPEADEPDEFYLDDPE